jgi:hypothetical protein
VSDTRVQVTGADEVARRLGSLSRSVDDLHGTYIDIANRVAAQARSFAPKVTGRLAGGVVGSATRRAGGVTIRGVPYAGVINFGWTHRHIAASLFMQRAADDKGPSTADQLGGEIRRDISRARLG